MRDAIQDDRPNTCRAVELSFDAVPSSQADRVAAVQLLARCAKRVGMRPSELEAILPHNADADRTLRHLARRVLD